MCGVESLIKCIMCPSEEKKVQLAGEVVILSFTSRALSHGRGVTLSKATPKSF